METEIISRILTHIQSEGISQSKLARAIGISRVSMNKIFLGKRKMSLMEYCAICKELGVSMNYFEKTKND